MQSKSVENKGMAQESHQSGLALPLVLGSAFGKMSHVQPKRCHARCFSLDNVNLNESMPFSWCSKEISDYSLHQHNPSPATQLANIFGSFGYFFKDSVPNLAKMGTSQGYL
ncbi:hypothetical protein TURU_100215 [Turdus rufiventris]|nr:hypothetical protein TURU_100215 [Turdus rufiventris]